MPSKASRVAVLFSRSAFEVRRLRLCRNCFTNDRPLTSKDCGIPNGRRKQRRGGSQITGSLREIARRLSSGGGYAGTICSLSVNQLPPRIAYGAICQVLLATENERHSSTT